MGARVEAIRLTEHVERVALQQKYTYHNLRKTIARVGA